MRELGVKILPHVLGTFFYTRNVQLFVYFILPSSTVIVRSAGFYFFKCTVYGDGNLLSDMPRVNTVKIF